MDGNTNGYDAYRYDSCFWQYFLLIVIFFPLFCNSAGGSEWAGGVAGVCWEWRRASEAPRLLPSMQGHRPQHNSLPRGRRWWHHCHRGVPRTKHQHDTSVSTFTLQWNFCCFHVQESHKPAASAFDFWTLWRRSSKTPLLSLCSVDCVGILKLRNADVEARIGVAGSKKKSTRARLVFRVNIPRPDGSMLTLQTPSSPILCSKSLPSYLSSQERPFFIAVFRHMCI